MLAFSNAAVRAQAPERRIVIAGGQCYYTTVDEETQLATLYRSAVGAPLSSAAKFALPAGRNYDEPLNLFSWDVVGDTLYALSLLNHPLADRAEALKRIPIRTLTPSGTLPAVDLLMQSAEANSFVPFEPYRALIAGPSTTLDRFHYDMVAMGDGSIAVVIANGGKWWLWRLKAGAWIVVEGSGALLDATFTLFRHQESLYLLTSRGGILKIESKPGREGATVEPSPDYAIAPHIVVEDRDNNAVYLLPSTAFNPTLRPVDLLRTASRLF